MKQELIQTVEFEKKFDNNGYIKIFLDGYWYSEHRYICEKLINRKLKDEERIHHIDGNKHNNFPDNLMLFENDKQHISFHNKVKQFKKTNPIKRQIENNIIQIKLRELNNE